MQITGSEVLAVGGTSAASSVIPPNHHAVMLTATHDCWFRVGDPVGETDPVAAADTDGSVFLAAGNDIRFTIVPGQKIAVIQDSAAGHLCIAYLS